MNFDLEGLLKIARMYYSFEDNTSLTIQEADANLHKALSVRKEYLANWQACLEDLKKEFPAYRLRDYSYEHYELSMRVQISIDESQGLFCCLSLLGRYIGFYYCDLNTKTCKGYSIHPIFSNSLNDYMCFSPFNEIQDQLKIRLCEILLTRFKDYQLVPSAISAYEVEQVYIEKLPYRNVQLFHLFFVPFIHGLL